MNKGLVEIDRIKTSDESEVRFAKDSLEALKVHTNIMSFIINL